MSQSLEAHEARSLNNDQNDNKDSVSMAETNQDIDHTEFEQKN